MEKALDKLNIPVKNGWIFGKKDIISFVMGILGFFLGRVWLFNYFNPIAIGYLSIYLFRNFRFLFYASLVLFGIFTSGTLYFPKYVICITIMICFNFLLKKKNIFISSLIGAVSVLAAGIITYYFINHDNYYLFISILESVFTFCIAFVLKKGANVLEGNVKKRLLTGEEIISTTVILGAVIAGASGVYFWNLSFRDFFSTLLILIIAYRGGVTLGALSGILIGLMLSVTQSGNANIIAILSVSGMLSGIYYNKNKFLTAAIYIISLFAMTFYIDRASVGTELLFSVLLASICFLAIKDKFYFNFLSFLNSYANIEDEYSLKIREVTTDKIESFSKAFNKLSITFKSISEKKTSLEQKDISVIIDDIAAKVCTNCKMSKRCWRDDFFNSFQAAFSILSAFEKKGDIKIEDIPVNFLNSCINIAYFVETAATFSEIYKIDLIWQNRIAESRELIAEQYSGISGILKELCEDIDSAFIFKEDIEAKLITEFKLNKIILESVIVLETKSGRYEIFLNMSEYINEADCIKNIVPIANRVIGRKFKFESEDIINYKIKLVEEQKFYITTAISKAVKDSSKESGDSYSFLEINNGYTLLALSDGMGSGFKAKEESKAAIELLEEFIESGFHKDLAIKIINSVLVLKSTVDSFSTLDICTIDNYSGAAEFLKIGASSTFLLRNDEVQVIKSTTLPMGILNDIDVEMVVKKLKDNDIVVMVTDGVLELGAYAIDREEWIIQALLNLNSCVPEEIANNLLNLAKQKSGGRIKDDMTVLAARIWEKF